MGTKGRKIERTLAGAEIGAFLRELLACLDGDEDTLLSFLPFAETDEVKLTLRRSADGLTAEVKARVPLDEALPGRPAPRGDPRRPDYKLLKGRMKRAFAALEAAARRGGRPAEETLRSFLADARTMATYPGKGDPDYPTWLAACADLEAAARDADPARLRTTVARLAALRSTCHDRYK